MNGHLIWVALRSNETFPANHQIDRTNVQCGSDSTSNENLSSWTDRIKALWIKLHALKTPGPDKFDYTHEAI